MNSIKQRRKKNGMTLQQLGLILGVNPSTISLWENNKKEPRVNAILILARLFDCSVEELMTPLKESA